MANESLVAANFTLVVATAKLAAATNLNIEELTIRAYSLQWEPISLQWVLFVSSSQSTNPNPSLLVTARANLAAASTHDSDQPSHITICAYQQNQPITTQSFALLQTHTIALTSLPKSSLSVCEMLYSLGTIDVFFHNFLQQSSFNQYLCKPYNSRLKTSFNILIHAPNQKTHNLFL